MANSCPSKKQCFAVKRGEYFRKYNIFEVDFDSRVCISMGCIHKKEYMTSHPSFILQTSIFVQNPWKWDKMAPSIFTKGEAVMCGAGKTSELPCNKLWPGRGNMKDDECYTGYPQLRLCIEMHHRLPVQLPYCWEHCMEAHCIVVLPPPSFNSWFTMKELYRRASDVNMIIALVFLYWVFQKKQTLTNIMPSNRLCFEELYI